MALRRHMKNFVKHYSEAEIKVREATSNDPWGPSSSLMLEISDLTYNTASLSEIMNMIWHRMNDHGKNWRHVYKSLTLLDYLLKNGSKKVIQHCQEGFFSIQMLKDFRHLDEAGKDQDFLPKASLPAEQSHPAQTLGKTEIVQETTALNIVSKKSSEDLIIFSEDEPSTTSVQSTFPTRFSREESAMATDTKASASEPWNASTVLSPSERGPLPLKKWDSSRKSKSSIISRVMMKSPPRKLSGKAYKAGATFFNACSSGPEEFIATNTRDSKTEFAPCTSGASVETIYRSSAFQGFAPLGKNITNSMKSTPTSSKQFYGPNTPSLQNLSFTLPNTLQTDGLSSHPSPRPDSASSVGTTSFSTFSMSPPESVVPNNTPQTHCVPSHGTSYLSSSHGLSSLLFKDLKERIVHSFSPFSMSDADENENASILNLLPDNSKEVNNCRSRTCRAFGESFMHNVTSVSNPSMPPAANLPSADLLCVSAEHKGMTILEEIKNAVCGLRGDFCSMAQELHIISSELTNMVAFIQNLNMFLATPQTPKDVPGQMSFSQQPAP
ncbi:ENTH domain-containing protein 1 isoform X2 [Hemicordylus capensis]|uniref:ENTH domain-containing protein 1 isoform X2 n=1 Tax=Hemicordylus capensis TaxID=884348 RepID=UPI0023029948|nr:ENTH domain-containing protein 1 isoform X2 [Hemicordylus capensis]